MEISDVPGRFSKSNVGAPAGATTPIHETFSRARRSILQPHVPTPFLRRRALSFQATDFEFRHRFWFIFGIFWLGFFLYPVDPVNASVALARLIVRHVSGAGPHLDAIIRAIFALGTLVAVLAAAIRTWAGAYLHSSVVHDSVLHLDRLVADGPYRYFRNPLYLGTVLIGIGAGTLASRIGFFVLVAGMILFTLRLIFREEANLLRSQGESYRRYCAAVPRLIPSPWPRVPSGEAKPNWRDGFNGELFMWGFVAALAVFTVTESLLYFWIVFGANFALLFARETRRRRKSAA
jgi:protein-S-isoprenylcysteine O-methyltransferase Ste14